MIFLNNEVYYYRKTVAATRLKIKKRLVFTSRFLKTNPNFNTNAPPFGVRGCKVILGGAFYAEGGATHLITHRFKNGRSIFDNY